MSEKLLTDEYKAQLRDNFTKVRDALAGTGNTGVTLLAATKTRSAEEINYAIDELGLEYIGENRVQELLAKYDGLHKDNKLHIHFIGRLQKNKVKYIADKVEMIHSLDSTELAAEIDRQCARHGRVMKALVEVNIGGEESKGGIKPCEVSDFIKRCSGYKNLDICGIMVIPPPCTSEEYMRYFGDTYRIYNEVFGDRIKNGERCVLSMGMSDSYTEAALCGATVVRVGSALFGERNYAV